MVVVLRFYFSLSLLIAVILSLGLFYLFQLEIKTKLNKAGILNLMHMLLHSEGGFKLHIKNESFKGKVNDDQEELEKLPFHP